MSLVTAGQDEGLKIVVHTIAGVVAVAMSWFNFQVYRSERGTAWHGFCGYYYAGNGVLEYIQVRRHCRHLRTRGDA